MVTGSSSRLSSLVPSAASALVEVRALASIAVCRAVCKAVRAVAAAVLSVSMLACNVVLADDIVVKNAGSSEIAAAISFNVSRVSGASANSVDICPVNVSTLSFRVLIVTPNADWVSSTATTLVP